MTDNPTPYEEAARAVVDFDRAVHDPNRTVDPVGMLFRTLGAAASRHAQETRAARTRWRNRPEAKARRSAAAKRGADTRRRRQEEELARARAEAERDARVPTVHCPHIDFTPHGSGETECVLEPVHPGRDHEDLDGHTWPNDCDGACEDVCEC